MIFKIVLKFEFYQATHVGYLVKLTIDIKKNLTRSSLIQDLWYISAHTFLSITHSLLDVLVIVIIIFVMASQVLIFYPLQLFTPFMIWSFSC